MAENLLSLNFKLEKEWPQYKTAVYRLDGDYPLRLVIRNGKIVGNVKSFYEVIPLEEVEELVNSVASALGLRRGKRYDLGSRLYCFYDSEIEDEFSDGSKIRVGIYALNSLDGSTGLRFDIFTYRDLCQNVVMIALKKIHAGVSISEVREYVKSLGTGFVKGESPDFGVIGSLSAIHTKKGAREWKTFKDRVESLLPFGKKILEIYHRWEEEKFTEEIAEKIIDSGVCKKYLKNVVEFNKKREVERVLVDNLFDAYNEITASIWHSNISLKVKEFHYRRLHKVLLSPILEARA